MDTDDLDRQLISLLQTNARAATAELARQLGVARTTVVARLARLERSGVILGYTVRLGQAADRPPVRAHVGITVQPRSGPAVVAALQTLTELVQLSSVSGEFDYIAVLQAASTQRLDALLDTIGQVAGVLKTTTSVVLALRIDRAT
jgi:DNA-binding Lrp family transcriptional regulator